MKLIKTTSPSLNQVNGKMKNNKNVKKKNSGFTLIELLVVISIIGILMGIIGPKVFDLLGGSKATKTQAVFKSWITQLYQYNEHYKYFPPFLLENEEGEAVILSEDDSYHDKFIAALKGRKWNTNSLTWEKLTGDLLEQNRKSREFHSFGEDEFGEDGFLADAWGGRDIHIVVDRNGDGIIELASATADQVIQALKRENDPELVDQAEEKIKVIRDKVGIFVLNDESGDTDTQNVFSWNIKKYLGDD